ncbi:Thioredoxin domain-containing protein 5, partial [Stegodyphus mimosarum]
MYTKCFIALFACICVFKFCICSDLYSDRVKKYDSETFKQNVGGGVPHFVNFFAPWCGYCKRLKPVWDELAEKYNVNSPNQKIVIAKVDCTVETPLCALEGISGYPSLIFYDAGELKGTKYQGKRDLLGLEQFINENLRGTRKKEAVPPISSNIKYKNGAVQLTDENFHSTINWGMHFVKFYAPWCGHCQKMAHAWEELAQNSQHDKSVTISKVDCTVNRKSCEEFEVKGYPTLLWIVNGKKMEKYQGARNLVAFKQFITDMKAAHKDMLENEEGKIPEAKENEPNMVVKLTNDNFKNAVTKDFSFVKFYVPWCGHSQRLAPVWNELAIKFAAHPKAKIAEVDCSKDEILCNEYKIVGYPSLLLFHNGERITEYNGPRKLEQLHSFILDYLLHDEL